MISYFQGAGTKIVSKSCKIVVADEVDAWPTEHPKNYLDLCKRTRSYNACMEFFVCSPTTKNGVIWQDFLKGSQGYYTLRCLGCGELTMRSCDIHNLQFESDYRDELKTYVVKKGTERLVCPICGFEHTEEMKRDMITRGEYVHKVPELVKERPSFQVGALASQLPALSWSEIAAQQLEAGKSADMDLQMTFDNSWRGLPFTPRAVSKDEIQQLRDAHVWRTAPSLKDTELVYITSDTMDNYSRYAVWAWTVNDHICLLEDGEVPYIELTPDKRASMNEELKSEGKPPVVTLEDILDKDFLKEDGVGIKATFIVIDQGGHKTSEVAHFAKMHKNVIMQKGTSMTSMNWKLSENQDGLVLTNEKFWKSTAIYYLYAQKNKQENFLYFNPSISEEALAELKDVVPDNTSKWGNEYSNWISKTGVDHLFDCLKYCYFAREFALNTLSRKRFRFGMAPSILRRFDRAMKKESQSHQDEIRKRSSWWNVL